MWFEPPVRIFGTQPGQELFQLCTLSGKLNAVFVGNVLLQFCHKFLIFPLVSLLIGAFAGELPVGILSHIAHLLEAAIPVGFDLCKRIRVRQRSQIDFFSLRNQPRAEVYKAVIAASVLLYDFGSIPQTILAREIFISLRNIVKVLCLFCPHRYQTFLQILHHGRHILTAGIFRLPDQSPECVFVDLCGGIVHIPPLLRFSFSVSKRSLIRKQIRPCCDSKALPPSYDHAILSTGAVDDEEIAHAVIAADDSDVAVVRVKDEIAGQRV